MRVFEVEQGDLALVEGRDPLLLDGEQDVAAVGKRARPAVRDLALRGVRHGQRLERTAALPARGPGRPSPPERRRSRRAAQVAPLSRHSCSRRAGPAARRRAGPCRGPRTRTRATCRRARRRDRRLCCRSAGTGSRGGARGSRRRGARRGRRPATLSRDPCRCRRSSCRRGRSRGSGRPGYGDAGDLGIGHVHAHGDRGPRRARGAGLAARRLQRGGRDSRPARRRSRAPRRPTAARIAARVRTRRAHGARGRSTRARRARAPARCARPRCRARGA